MTSQTQLSSAAPAHQELPEMGVLRSEITLTLHSQYATRLWIGRPPLREGNKLIKPAIMSIPKCITVLSQLQKDAAADDPYADYYLLKFENMVLDSTEQMKQFINDLIETHGENVPEGVDIQRCANIQPACFQIFADSPLAYKLIYLLCEYDTLAKTVMTASYIAVLTRLEAREWLEAGAILIRRCFGAIEHYRYTGITRDDVRNHTARYQEAQNRFKLELPQGVIDGTERARFAPVIRKNDLDKTPAMEEFNEDL